MLSFNLTPWALRQRAILGISKTSCAAFMSCPPRKNNLFLPKCQPFQEIIRNIYDAKDRRRGVEGTFMWFMEEVGELSAALRSGSDAERAAEFADVLAWLATLANIAGVDLEEAVQAKYGAGCPGCRQSPCMCDQMEKP